MGVGVKQEQLQKELGECVLSKAWFFSVVGCLVSVPLGIRNKSLSPLVFYGGAGAMLDLIVGVSICEKERAALKEHIVEEKRRKEGRQQ